MVVKDFLTTSSHEVVLPVCCSPFYLCMLNQVLSFVMVIVLDTSLNDTGRIVRVKQQQISAPVAKLSMTLLHNHPVSLHQITCIDLPCPNFSTTQTDFFLWFHWGSYRPAIAAIKLIKAKIEFLHNWDGWGSSKDIYR